MQRGNYLCKASDAVKLAAIHYYVWHGPYDAAKEVFTLPYMRELRLGEQLMPTPLVTAQVMSWSHPLGSASLLCPLPPLASRLSPLALRMPH